MNTSTVPEFKEFSHNSANLKEDILHHPQLFINIPLQQLVGQMSEPSQPTDFVYYLETQPNSTFNKKSRGLNTTFQIWESRFFPLGFLG